MGAIVPVGTIRTENLLDSVHGVSNGLRRRWFLACQGRPGGAQTVIIPYTNTLIQDRSAESATGSSEYFHVQAAKHELWTVGTMQPSMRGHYWIAHHAVVLIATQYVEALETISHGAHSAALHWNSWPVMCSQYELNDLRWKMNQTYPNIPVSRPHSTNRDWEIIAVVVAPWVFLFGLVFIWHPPHFFQSLHIVVVAPRVFVHLLSRLIFVSLHVQWLCALCHFYSLVVVASHFFSPSPHNCLHHSCLFALPLLCWEFHHMHYVLTSCLRDWHQDFQGASSTTNTATFVVPF